MAVAAGTNQEGRTKQTRNRRHYLARCAHRTGKVCADQVASTSQPLSVDEWSHQKESAGHQFEEDEKLVPDRLRVLSKNVDNSCLAVQTQNRHRPRQGSSWRSAPDFDCETERVLPGPRHLHDQRPRAIEGSHQLLGQVKDHERARLRCAAIRCQSLPA